MNNNDSIRIAMAQINTCVGDIRGNTKKIISYIDQAKALSCDIVVFPELAVCGYPPEDLLFKKSFIDENINGLKEISRKASGIIAVVGFVDRKGGCLFNSAAVIANAKTAGIYHKAHLPNYGVFDEKRYLSKGAGFSLYEFKGVRFAVNICEDLWAGDGSLRAQVARGAVLILALNASPYHMGKIDLRKKILKSQAVKNRVYIVYVNLTGGQDELVFDGRSMCVSSSGEVICNAPAFEESLSVFDIGLGILPKKKKTGKAEAIVTGLAEREARGAFLCQAHVPLGQSEEVFKALVCGVRDYLCKNGFKKVVLGLSGGIDSSLVAAVAKEALGKENVLGVILPSRFNSAQSSEDAIGLAQNLGIEYKIIPIQELFEEYLRTLKPHFMGVAWNIAEENIQARIRGNILMGLSNKFGWLVLTTGNKSEMSTGYATLYGDMAGGFAVIKDVPKTLVYTLCDFYNERSGNEIIPRRVFEKAPTAELRENQKDSDTLSPYEILDPILKYYVEEDIPAGEIVKKGFSPEAVSKTIRMVDKSEYKRRQSPPGIKITPRSFGRDRRMPITNKFQETI